MFGEARIVSDDGRLAVALPASAVQRVRDTSLVFVRLKPAEFQVRRVELGPREGDLVEVTRGVRPGEEVVAQGSFILKTETLKDSIGDGCTDD